MSLRLRVLSFIDVAARYRQVFWHHWRQRRLESGNTYTAQEAEFLPASLALIERPVSPTARLTGGLLVLLVFLVILWAVLARVDIIVSAGGKVIPSTRTKAIASVDVASVRAIHVVEGQAVKAGDVLLELDAGVFEAEERKADADVDAARLEMATAKALIAAIDSNRPPVLSSVAGIGQADYEDAKSRLTGQYLDYRAKSLQIEGEIDRYARALPLAQARVRSYEELVKTRDVAANDWSEKQQAAIDLEGQLVQAQNSRSSLTAQTRRQALDAFTEARRVVMSATQDAARAASHARLLVLRAPVDGSVQQLAVHTIGGVVPAAQPLMLIVPKQDHIELEAYVDNKDMGFVREGQTVAVKIDAFDYTKYGLIAGEVVSLSKDALEDEDRGLIYKTKIRLERPFVLVEGHRRELAPGMAVTAEIKTGTRRVIDYVLSPLLRHRHESLDER